ncbi:MAG: hypothetical protein QNJ12_03905 [Ilumatobacter sp.]|uniref:hypothetical protein n=1 Tax=Ilumatobacter sp. TaxID=1967498 RepID=UPI00262FAC01|nr:hypothetical protein [Ilumatobacter sp.]MDJ0767907.1 hypothetical protein [Ilumatobacter sp.]
MHEHVPARPADGSPLQRLDQTAAPPSNVGAALLALQRSAGNAAVARLVSHGQHRAQRLMSDPLELEAADDLTASFDPDTNEVRFGGRDAPDYCRAQLGFVPTGSTVAVSRLPPDVVSVVAAAFPDMANLGDAPTALGAGVYAIVDASTGVVRYSGPGAPGYLIEGIGFVPSQLVMQIADLPDALRDDLRGTPGFGLEGEADAGSEREVASTGDPDLDRLRAARRQLQNASIDWRRRSETLWNEGSAAAARLVDACLDVIGQLRVLATTEIGTELEEFSGSLRRNVGWAAASTAVGAMPPPGFGIVAGFGVSLLGAELGRDELSSQVRAARESVGRLVERSGRGDASVIHRYFDAHATVLDDVHCGVAEIHGSFAGRPGTLPGEQTMSIFASQLAGANRTEEDFSRENPPEESRAAVAETEEALGPAQLYTIRRQRLADVVAGLDERVAAVRAASDRVVAGVRAEFLRWGMGHGFGAILLEGTASWSGRPRVSVWVTTQLRPTRFHRQSQAWLDRIGAMTWDEMRELRIPVYVSVNYPNGPAFSVRQSRNGGREVAISPANPTWLVPDVLRSALADAPLVGRYTIRPPSEEAETSSSQAGEEPMSVLPTSESGQTTFPEQEFAW